MRGIYLILCCLTTTITFPIAIGAPHASTNDDYEEDNLDKDYEPEEKYETPTSTYWPYLLGPYFTIKV